MNMFSFFWAILARAFGFLPFSALFAHIDPPAGGGSTPPATPPARGIGGAANPTEEIRAAIAQVRDAIGQHNKDFASRIDEIDKQVQAGRVAAEEVKTLRTELDAIRAAAEQREQTITELQRRQREQSLAVDGNLSERRALEIFGMGCRAMLARHMGSEIPAQFRNEATVLRNFEQTRAAMMGRDTLSADASPGTLMIPTLLESQIVDGVEEVSPLLSLVNFITGLPGNVDLTVLTGRPSLQPKRATVDTNMTAGNPAFTNMQLRPDEAYIFVPVDNRLLSMNAHALGSYMMPLLRDATLQGIVTWLIAANGTSNYNSLVGILAQAAAADVQVTTGTGFATCTYADLVKIRSKALQRARARGRWLLSESLMWEVFGELSRTGKVPVITTNSSGEPLLLGSPVVFDEAMPTVAETAPGTGFIGFGDLAAYVVGLQGGISMAASTEYLFGKNQTAFRSVLNLDIKKVPAPLFILGKSAAE